MSCRTVSSYWRRAALLTFSLLFFTVAAQASVVVPLEDIFSTGVDNAGNKLPIGAVDPHYYLVNAPDIYPSWPNSAYPNYPTVYATDPEEHPTNWFGYEDAPNVWAAVQWVAPRPAYGPTSGDPAGPWWYQTTFHVGEDVDLSTVLLWGSISSDNCTQEIYVNGTKLSGWSMTPGTCLSQSHLFQIGGYRVSWNDDMGEVKLHTGAFQYGVNTITFRVANFNDSNPYNPTGLGVWFRGSGRLGYVPEPSTVVLVGAGLAAVAALARRRRA